MRNARTRGAFFLRGGRRDESPPARRRRSRLKTETTSPKFRVRARRAPTGPPPRREERTRVSFLPCFAFETFFANDTERTDRRVRREKRYRITTVYRAKNRTSARTHVGPHYTTPLTKNKKKKASAAKKDATMVLYQKGRLPTRPRTRRFLFKSHASLSVPSHPHRLPSVADPEVVVQQQAVGYAVLPVQRRARVPDSSRDVRREQAPLISRAESRRD